MVKASQSFRRGDVYWVHLDPTIGTEINKTRPGLTVSPADMNAILPQVIIAPIASKGQPLGCQPLVPFKGKEARILLDQLRAVDKRRLTQKMGVIEPALWHEVLLEMLA